MNEYKVYRETLKALLDYKVRKPFYWHVSDDEIFFSSNGYMGFFCKVDNFPLNLKLLDKSDKVHIEKPKDLSEMKKLVMKDIALVDSRRKKKELIRQLSDGELKVAVREEYLSYFDENCYFYGTDALSTVYVYEHNSIGDSPAGAVMPCRADWGDDK